MRIFESMDAKTPRGVRYIRPFRMKAACDAASRMRFLANVHRRAAGAVGPYRLLYLRV